MSATMPRMTIVIAGLAGCALLFSSARAAEEESPKLKKARIESELEKEAASTDEACGTKIDVQIDWAGFDGKDWADKSVSGYCEAPLGALRSYCEGPASKAHIQKSVKTFVCKAAKDKARWKATFKGGTLEWHVSPDSSNNDSYAKEQLLKNL